MLSLSAPISPVTRDWLSWAPDQPGKELCRRVSPPGKVTDEVLGHENTGRLDAGTGGISRALPLTDTDLLLCILGFSSDSIIL